MRPDPVKLLIVDDVPANLDALDALLGGNGIELLRAESGPEALELLLVHEVALALLDVQMPGMDGFELAELMRGAERTRSIPIIFLTAVATDERRRFRGYETGAVDYLLKPVDAQVVRSKVAIFCELARQRQELARQRDVLAAALNRLQAHTDNSPLAVVEFDPDLRIISWSGGAERLFGYTAREAVGSKAAELRWLASEEEALFTALVEEMRCGRHLREMQTHRVAHRDGSAVDCEWYCSALFDSAGRLSSVNVQILDVTERKRAEETRRLLVGELNHRVKNTLATVQAVATQTLKHAADLSEFKPMFMGRIHALARAHSLLSATTWQGAKLRDLVETQLQIGAIDESRLIVSGANIELPAETALRLALVLHELTTNANKYGALSNSSGKVELDWCVRGGNLEISWIESGGPPVAPPSGSGFGSVLIERGLKADGGGADVSYAPEGVRWKLTMPFEGDEPPEPAPLPTLSSQPGARPGRDALPSSRTLSGKRLLVIEDEPLVGMEVALILGDAGADVIGPATTIEEALDLIASKPVDGALLDANLQGRSVEAVAEALVAGKIPFAFVSGYGTSHLPAGFNATALEKPFDPKRLLEVAIGLTTDHLQPTTTAIAS